MREEAPPGGRPGRFGGSAAKERRIPGAAGVGAGVAQW